MKLYYEYRQLGQHGYCRVCKNDIKKDTEKVFRVFGNKEWITICRSCIGFMNFQIAS
jgi:hypothetical protein